MRWMIIFLLGLPVVTSAQFTTIQLPTTDNIRHIICRDSLCIASDDRERLIFSTDNFNTWRVETVPILAGEAKMRFRVLNDSTMMFLSGSAASFFRHRISVSRDYGETWDVIWDAPGSVGDFAIANDSVYFVAQFLGDLFRTSNGGETWSNVLNSSRYFFQMEYFSPDFGVLSYFGGLASSSDYFDSWIGYEAGKDLYGRDLCIINSSTALGTVSWNTGGQAEIYKTTNKGQSWQRKPPPLYNYSIWQLAFQDSLIGYVSGKYIPQDTGMVFTTIDGGETWNTSVRVPTNRQLLSIAVANDTTVLIGATGGKLFRWNPKQWVTDLASATPPFSLSLQPNPASATQQLSIRSDQYGQATISIYDMNGRLIKQIPSSIITPGEQSISMDISSWPAGIYVYRVEMNGEYVTLKGQKV